MIALKETIRNILRSKTLTYCILSNDHGGLVSLAEIGYSDPGRVGFVRKRRLPRRQTVKFLRFSQFSDPQPVVITRDGCPLEKGEFYDARAIAWIP